MTSTLLLRSQPDQAAGSLRGVAGALDRAAADGDTVAVVADDLIAPEAALSPVLDPFTGTAVLVHPDAAGSVRVRHHVAVAIGSHAHAITAASHRLVGALSIGPVDAAPVAATLRALADAVDDGRVPSGDAFGLVAFAVAAAGVSARAIEIVPVPWGRASVDPAALRAAADAVPADLIARLQANRLDDGFYSTFIVRKLSKPITRLALRRGWTPNAVTLASFAIGIAAAVFFAFGERWALVVGALLLQLSLVVDCVDGEVARATRKFSALGAWLDASTDRVKEFLAYAGLAVGAAAVSGIDLWPLAIVLVVLLTTRHMTDYAFSRVQRAREARVEVRAVDELSEVVTSGGGIAAAMEVSSRINRHDAVRWAKRVIHLPIGERWLLISVLAALFGARVALIGLLVAGLVALAYVMAGRSLRTLTWHGPSPQDAALLLARQSDAGPVASTLARGMSPAGWMAVWSAPAAWAIPAALRFIELGAVAVIVLTLAPQWAPLAFAWVALVAFHHYDLLYRALQGMATPRWIVWSGLGWDGRTIVIALAALAGAATLGVVLLVGSWAWAILLVVIASAQWLLTMSAAQRARTKAADE